jgi:inorganic pyrophosphatase
MWLNELAKLREQYVEYKEERSRQMSGAVGLKKAKKVVKKNLVIEG